MWIAPEAAALPVVMRRQRFHNWCIRKPLLSSGFFLKKKPPFPDLTCISHRSPKIAASTSWPSETSPGLEFSRCRATCEKCRLVPRSLDPAPKLLHPVVRLRRDGQNLVQLQPLFQRQQVARPLVAAETDDLGGDHGKLPPRRPQPVDQLPVALLRGHIRIHQADAQLERRADRQVRLNECRPPRRNRL